LDNGTRIVGRHIEGTPADEETMSQPNHFDRRSFIGTALTAIAGAGVLAPKSGTRQPSSGDTVAAVNHADARGSNVRYADGGPANGPAVILLHGGSGGIDADFARLATRGYRVIVPYVAGAGTSDITALMATLKIEKALVGGLGESARAAEVMAALWPQRLKAIVPTAGSGVVTLAASQRALPPNEELAWWHQYYFIRKGEA
jgi:hypothetical protein